MPKLFFQNDPLIEFRPVFCTFCNQRSGRTSECYKIPPKNVPDHQKFMESPKFGRIPIFVENCPFRIAPMWYASINYPASKPLIKRIGKIPGITSVSAVDANTLQFSIGAMFSEVVVKRAVAETFKAFIKELQAKELNSQQPKENEEKIEGIIFPNGEVHNNPELSDTYKFLLNNFPSFTKIIPDEKRPPSGI